MTHDNVTDIERLRSIAGSLRRGRWLSNGEEARIEQAASTIATLRKQLANARAEALEEAAKAAENHMTVMAVRSGAHAARLIAKELRALKGPQ